MSEHATAIASPCRADNVSSAGTLDKAVPLLDGAGRLTHPSHHGRIDVSREPGADSSFRMASPVAPPPMGAA